MQKDAIEQSVKEFIAMYSKYRVNEIKLTNTLAFYFNSGFKDLFSFRVKKKYSKVDTTYLINNLFVTIKTGTSLVDYIYKLYERFPV